MIEWKLCALRLFFSSFIGHDTAIQDVLGTNASDLSSRVAEAGSHCSVVLFE